MKFAVNSGAIEYKNSLHSWPIIKRYNQPITFKILSPEVFIRLILVPIARRNILGLFS